MVFEGALRTWAIRIERRRNGNVTIGRAFRIGRKTKRWKGPIRRKEEFYGICTVEKRVRTGALFAPLP
jgi:hypothetical protein